MIRRKEKSWESGNATGKFYSFLPRRDDDDGKAISRNISGRGEYFLFATSLFLRGLINEAARFWLAAAFLSKPA
jgi:hypothetical protein